MSILSAPDTVAQPAPHATLTVEFSHGTRWNVLRDGECIGFLGLRSGNDDRPYYWAEPVRRSFGTIEAALVAIERAAVRAEAEAA